jgi:hypothetical protein
MEYKWLYGNYMLLNQPAPEGCATPPPACTLEITSYVASGVTVRGDDDGQIYATISGWTGTTADVIWYLNGTPIVSGTSGYTFTGLTAGIYAITVIQGQCFDSVQGIDVIDGEFRTADFNATYQTALVAVENPIILRLATAVNTGSPLAGKSTFAITGTISDGDSVTITLEYPQAYTAVFTAKDFPNRDDYFLASILKNGNGNTVGSNTTIEIATSLAEAFNKDVILSRLYYFRADTIYVYATAKEMNSKLNLVTGVTVTTSGNITCTETVIGVSQYDGQIVQNYSLYADVYVNKSAQYGQTLTIDTFNKVSQLELPFQTSNEHFFDLSPILKNFVSTSKIDFSVTGYTTLADMMCSYMVQYGEKYPLVPNESTKKSRVKATTSQLFCINSALDWEEENDMDEHIGIDATNLNPNFGFTLTPVGSIPYDWDVLFTNVLISTGNTGTTSVEVSIWNYDNTSQVESWRAYTSGFNNLAYNYYYGRVSGITDGVTYMFSRRFIVTPYGQGQPDNSIYPVPKNNIMFLENAPTPKLCQRNSSEYLYVVLPRDYGYPLKVKGDLFFYDGSVEIGQTLYTITTGNTNWGGVFALAAGYNELNLASYEVLTGDSTRKIRRVDFAIYQTINGLDIPLTEEKSYRYEIDEQPRRYGVAFQSKHGVWDIFDFSGEIVNDVNFSNEEMEVPRAITFKGNSPYGFQAKTVYDTKVTKKIACNSGWIDEEHFDWLIELLGSNRIYNYTDTVQPFLIVKSVNYQKSSNDDLFNIDVVFEETLHENNISV